MLAVNQRVAVLTKYRDDAGKVVEHRRSAGADRHVCKATERAAKSQRYERNSSLRRASEYSRCLPIDCNAIQRPRRDVDVGVGS